MFGTWWPDGDQSPGWNVAMVPLYLSSQETCKKTWQSTMESYIWKVSHLAVEPILRAFHAAETRWALIVICC